MGLTDLLFHRRRREAEARRRVLGVLQPVMPDHIISIELLNPRRRNSFQIKTKQGTFKAFFCQSSAEANLVAQLLEALGPKGEGVTPGVFLQRGALLVSPWVEGQPLGARLAIDRERDLLYLLRQVHGASIPLVDGGRKISGSPYIPMLCDRLLRAQYLLGQTKVLDLRESLIQLEPREARPSVLHLDLTVGNVVISPSGQALIIDNEALSIGNGRAFDAWHAADSIFSLKKPDKMINFVCKYDQLAPGSKAVEYASYWLGVCWAKKALKSLESGRLIKGRRALERARRIISA